MKPNSKMTKEGLNKKAEQFFWDRYFISDAIFAITENSEIDVEKYGVLDVLNMIIDEYEKKLREKLVEHDYKIIQDLLVKYNEKFSNKAQKEKDSENFDTQGVPGFNFDFNSYFDRFKISKKAVHYDIGYVASSIIESIKDCLYFYKNDEKACYLVAENSNSLVSFVLGVMVISTYKTSSAKTFVDALRCIGILSSLEIFRIGDFFDSQDFKGLIVRSVTSKGQNKRWADVNKKTELAKEKIIEMWDNGDLRLHDKISKFVVGKINEPVLNPIKKRLLKKYPNKEFDAAEKEQFDEELKKMSFGKIVSVDRVMDEIFDYACKIGRANDPLKGVRKNMVKKSDLF